MVAERAEPVSDNKLVVVVFVVAAVVVVVVAVVTEAPAVAMSGSAAMGIPAFALEVAGAVCGVCWAGSRRRCVRTRLRWWASSRQRTRPPKSVPIATLTAKRATRVALQV